MPPPSASTSAMVGRCGTAGGRGHGRGRGARQIAMARYPDDDEEDLEGNLSDYYLGPEPPSDSDASSTTCSSRARSSSGFSGSGSSSSKTKRQKLSVQQRNMNVEQRAVYKAAYYQHAKDADAQSAFFAKYKWLGKDAQKGIVCKQCINSTLKPEDNLSTNGYGYTGSDDDNNKVLVPIPSEQKLRVHENHPAHKHNAIAKPVPSLLTPFI
eukprot:scaffold193251_cov24-Tisochrysis_lutea.AAC.1